MKILDPGAQPVGEGDAVAGGNFGVRGVLIHPSDASGGQQTDPSVDVADQVGVFLDHIQVEAAVFFQQRHQRIFPDGHVGQGADIGQKRPLYFAAGGVFVMDDSGTAVSPFQGVV